jgi:hypothetical protein
VELRIVKLASFCFPKGGVEQMRKLLAVAVVAAFAATASAGQLSMRFVGGDDDTNATVNQGDSIVVEVLWSNAPVDTGGIAGLAFNLTAGPEAAAAGTQGDAVADADLSISGNGSGLTNWNGGGAPGGVGTLGRFEVFANTGADAFLGAGPTVVGTFSMNVDAGAALGAHTFYVQRNPGSLSPDIGQNTGAAWTYDSFGLAGTVPHFYGIANGFAGADDGSGAIPMNINVEVPEPASLALLALGGIAVLRRRS